MSRSANSSNKKAEATGYSQSFSIEEALRNAIASLPPLPGVPTEQLERIKLLETGVEQGTLAGTRLFVRVRRVYPVPRQARRSSRSRQH